MSPTVCDLHVFAFACEWLQFVSVFDFFVCVFSSAARRFPLEVFLTLILVWLLVVSEVRWIRFVN